MATVTQSQAPSDIVPFFEDTRTITEKLLTREAQWIPHKQEEDPHLIFGLLIATGEYISSDYRDKDGNQKVSETMTVLEAANNVEWSVIAFAGYLAGDIRRKKPAVGDFVAISYNGIVPAKKAGMKDAWNYSLQLVRNPNPVAAPAPEPIVERELETLEQTVVDELKAIGATEVPDDAAPADTPATDDIPY